MITSAAALIGRRVYLEGRGQANLTQLGYKQRSLSLRSAIFEHSVTLS
jgi:hypothetical protein